MCVCVCWGNVFGVQQCNVFGFVFFLRTVSLLIGLGIFVQSVVEALAAGWLEERQWVDLDQ